MPGEMNMAGYPPMGEQMSEEEKAEEKRKQFLRDTLYFQNTAKQMAAIDIEHLSGNPKAAEILRETRDIIDKMLSGSDAISLEPGGPGVETEELEELPPDNGGPLAEDEGKKRVRSLGFGARNRVSAPNPY